MLYTRFSVAPPMDMTLAGYHEPSPEYFARQSSPADKACPAEVLALFRLSDFEDEAASAWAIAACDSSMSSFSPSRNAESSAFVGSVESASSTGKVGLDKPQDLSYPLCTALKGGYVKQRAGSVAGGRNDAGVK